jgi:hypothetical protein
MAMRNKMIQTHCKTGSEIREEEELEIMTGALTKPLGWHTPAQASNRLQHARIDVDGEQLIFSADKEIVLKCGKVSITLTRAGKIILGGTYLSGCSSGVNRIKGGSVQID